MAKPGRQFGVMARVVGFLRQLTRAGFTVAEATREVLDSGFRVSPSTVRVAAKRAAAGTRAVLRLFEADWRSKVDWADVLGVKREPEFIKVHAKVRKLDTSTGRGDWVSAVVALKTPAKAGDLVRSLYEQISDQAESRGSPTGPLGEVRRDRLQNISIEVIEPV